MRYLVICKILEAISMTNQAQPPAELEEIDLGLAKFQVIELSPLPPATEVNTPLPPSGQQGGLLKGPDPIPEED